MDGILRPAKLRTKQYHHVFSNKLKPDLLQTIVEWLNRKGTRKKRERLFKMSSSKEKGAKSSKIGGLVETNSESAATGEMHRIIMRDGFHYFAVAE